MPAKLVSHRKQHKVPLSLKWLKYMLHHQIQASEDKSRAHEITSAYSGISGGKGEVFGSDADKGTVGLQQRQNAVPVWWQPEENARRVTRNRFVSLGLSLLLFQLQWCYKPKGNSLDLWRGCFLYFQPSAARAAPLTYCMLTRFLCIIPMCA